MIRNLYPESRRQELLRLIHQQGQVTVSELSEKYRVSEVTIRSDLQFLHEQGLIIRTHGGAILADKVPDLSLNLRRLQQVEEKNRIGKAAAKFVSNGEAIFLDTSSTALALANNLKAHRDLTVITNSLAIAQLFLDTVSVTVVVIGGTLQRDTASFVGVAGIDLVRKFNIQKGFFGAHGISIPEGLTDVSAAEADFKKEMVLLCKKVICIIDSTKWGKVGLASFASIDQIHMIVTDSHVTNPIYEHIVSKNIPIIRA